MRVWGGVRIVNIEGENVGKRKIYREYDIPEYSVDDKDVRQAIDDHTCISFDLFDTLIMRKVLFPFDIFECAVRRLHLPDKTAKRLIWARKEIEKEAKALRTITEIYNELAKRCCLSGEERDTIRRTEFEIEKENIVGRRACIDLLDYARLLGKKIYVLTDMYYQKAQLKILCNLCGVAVEEDEILSSCEIKCTKESGEAYQVLINAFGEDRGSILHIGDNQANDYRNALKWDIDAIRILSGYEMLLNSSMASLLSDTLRYEKRCVLGLLTERLFNNPFSLNHTKGKVMVSGFEDTGYVFGIVFYSFCQWLIEEAFKRDIELLILPGRDGYLIEEILDILKPPFRYTYIAASRKCYELASILNEWDIRQIVEKTSFKGSKEKLFHFRFGIEKLESFSEEEWIRVILKEAFNQRRQLLDYFKKMGLDDGYKKVGVFDCVASGTVHMYLEKLLGTRLQGFYFGVKLPSKEGLSILSAFGSITDYEVKSKVLEHYLLLENMLSAMSGTLTRFEKGNMIFEDNVPSVNLPKVQSGILRFVQDAHKLFLEADFLSSEELVREIFKGAINFADMVRSIFTYDDSYLGESRKVRIWQ